MLFEQSNNLDKVCFGDFISLYSEESGGYVFSYQSSSAHNEIGVMQKQDKNLPSLPNIHGAVFQICVQNRYKFNKDLPKLRSELQENPSNLALWNQLEQTKVELRKENAKSALFKILPRYKVKAEGDLVQVDDQVIFESVKSLGQYLRCSREIFGPRMVYSHS